jgi:hypothetical protein
LLAVRHGAWQPYSDRNVQRDAVLLVLQRLYFMSEPNVEGFNINMFETDTVYADSDV